MLLGILRVVREEENADNDGAKGDNIKVLRLLLVFLSSSLQSLVILPAIPLLLIQV
jgi:hypothetical protein